MPEAPNEPRAEWIGMRWFASHQSPTLVERVSLKKNMVLLIADYYEILSDCAHEKVQNYILKSWWLIFVK